MRWSELQKIKKYYFGYFEISRVLNIKPSSARVYANRYVKNGLLIRVKRDLYVLKERWKYFTREQKLEIANLLQVPSYISLVSALDYYEITTQMQRDFIESVVLKRTKEVSIADTFFNYTKLSKNLYFGFEKVDNFFMATPEKAFLDAFYLMSLGRYQFDLTALDIDKLNKKLLTRILKKFPVFTQNMMEKYGLIQKA
jgi:predicted transcriptional regulator of viral defense system